MGKIFTITEGLQNMGALRTGGQGSVYKGKRTGEILVAVKLLPTPIYTETEDDKNFRDFKNEVEKLKKVNEKPNPNVVKILNSGITESGSLPFIEMEFIEGPDLGELLKPPHDPVFTIPEIIKVADQLANALSHCHKVLVKHGDIKSNNVKFNATTGNYVLLDFGLAIMSNEQRRDSLRHAGAVEFMAPEQNEGKMLPQSDVYSYGIVLYELLAGTVPFPLNDIGQTARNAVMLAHMDSIPSDPIELRRQNSPQSWSKETRERELQVPEWLLNLIDKCLQKNPDDRYADGTELHDAILFQHSALAIKNDTEGTLILQNENEQLQSALTQERAKTKLQSQQIAQLKETLAHRNEQLSSLAGKGSASRTASTGPSLSKGALIAAILILVCLGAAAGHFLFPAKTSKTELVRDSSPITSEKPVPEKNVVVEKKRRRDSVRKQAVAAKKIPKDSFKPKPVIEAPVDDKPTESAPVKTGDDVGKVFTLFNSYAYFHDKPNAATVRKANINRWNNARLKALNDQNGFIYVIYTNEQGQTSKGWLNKKDLIVVGQ